MIASRYLTAAACAAAMLLSIVPARAQGQDWFVPGQGGAAGKPGAARPAASGGHSGATTPAVRPGQPAAGNATTALPSATAGGPGEEQPAEGQIQVQLPPPPELPPIPKGAEPPTPRIGVLGVPEVMRASTAAQAIERIIGERRQKLNEDAQKEQAAWRDLQQTLSTQRTGLTPEQIRAKERELQERVTNAQRTFRERDKVIQDAAKYSLAQIERALITIIRQVAESRGMNLVLHRQQVALNVAEFDITDQVTQQLNKALPSVVIPGDGVSVAQMAQAAPARPAGGAPVATTAGAPAAAAPTAAPPAADATPPATTTPAAPGQAPAAVSPAPTTTAPPAKPARH